MRDSLNQILDNCPTHGHMSHAAHLAFCPNEDHKVIVNLVETYDELTEPEFGGTAECPGCGKEFLV